MNADTRRSNDSDQRGSASYTTHLLVLLGYLLLSIVLTWPLALHWHTGYVGNFEEATRNSWNIWWVRWALEHGQNPFWCPLLYYPEGLQMYVQPINISNTLLTLPVYYLFGLAAAHNTATLLAFVLTGYGGFLLVRAFVPGTAIPFLCGALLTAGPFHMVQFEFNHLNLLTIQWLPLFFLSLLWLDRGEDAKTRRHEASPQRLIVSSSQRLIGFAVAMFVITALTDWYWALFGGIYTLLWFGISFGRSPERWTLLRRYALFGAGVLLCLSPLLIGIFRFRELVPTIDIAQDAMWRGYVQGFSGDALGMFFPTMYHPLWGEPVREALQQTAPGYSPSGWYIAAGWLLLACAGLGVWVSWRTHWQLLVVAAVLWLLSLGPTLRVAGMDTGVPMPYVWLEGVELLSTARKPSHFAVVCIVLATVFAGIGLQHLTRSFAPRRRAAVLLGVAALATIELWPALPQDVRTFEQHVIFQRIREKPGVVVDLPLEWRESGRALRNQMVHTQPLVAGYVSRRPVYESFYIPHINQIGRMRHRPDIVPVSHEALAAMQCLYPIRHVVVRKEAETPGSRRELQSFLAALADAPIQPAYEDARYVWYELPFFPNACQPFVYLGQGWYDVEGTAGANWRWTSGDNDIWLVNPFEEPLVARMDILTDSFAFPRPVELWHGEQRIAQWYVGNVPRRATVVVSLQPGQNRLQLRTEPWREAATGRQLGVPVREVSMHSTTGAE